MFLHTTSKFFLKPALTVKRIFFSKNIFLVGYSDSLSVTVTVQNLKEPAYYTNLDVIVDGFSGGDITPQDSSCAFQNTSLHCVLGTIDENANVKDVKRYDGFIFHKCF